MPKLIALFSALVTLPFVAIAQNPDYNSVAERIINQSAEVKPGEIVLIKGSVESLGIMEALVTATFIAGAHAIPTIDFPGARIKIAQESPMEFLRQERIADITLLEAFDVLIQATPGFTSAVLSLDIPMERRVAAQQGRASYYEAVSSSSHREIYIGQSSGVPSQAFADDVSADLDQMKDIFWKAVDVAPAELEVTAMRVADSLKGGAEIRLSGPGTDLTFTLSDNPLSISTGRVSENPSGSGPVEIYLPAGELAACVQPTSANGVVTIPVYTFQFQNVFGLSLTFEDGVITGMAAESGGENLSDFLDTLDDASRTLSLVNVGLNTESRVIPGSSYRSWEMGGVVTVFTGDNTIYGCNHTADLRLHPHIENLSLTADGQPVVVGGVVQ